MVRKILIVGMTRIEVLTFSLINILWRISKDRNNSNNNNENNNYNFNFILTYNLEKLSLTNLCFNLK